MGGNRLALLVFLLVAAFLVLAVIFVNNVAVPFNESSAHNTEVQLTRISAESNARQEGLTVTVALSDRATANAANDRAVATRNAEDARDTATAVSNVARNTATAQTNFVRGTATAETIAVQVTMTARALEVRATATALVGR